MTDTDKARVLIVDDDDGILQISRMSLKRVRFRGRRLDILLASSGGLAVSTLSEQTGVGVMLIDGEMETNTAGLDTCRAIREELGNEDLRILLRTGKVDMDAKEREAARKWDLQGHLPKGDTSKDDLVDAVLGALEAYYLKIEGVSEAVRVSG